MVEMKRGRVIMFDVKGRRRFIQIKACMLRGIFRMKTRESNPKNII
jgi:hypothetical protein